MRSTKVVIVETDPVSGPEGFDVSVEWRYANDIQPYTWHVAKYSAHVRQDGLLEIPVEIIYDEAEDNDIFIKITYLGCTDAPPYIIRFNGPANTTTTSTTTKVPETIIVGVVDVLMAPTDHVGGIPTIVINFEDPVPVYIKFRWGFDFIGLQEQVKNCSIGYPPEHTYPGCTIWSTSSSYDAIGGNVELFIGDTTFEGNAYGPTEPNHLFAKTTKVVVFSLNQLPPNHTLILLPARADLGVEIR